MDEGSKSRQPQKKLHGVRHNSNSQFEMESQAESSVETKKAPELDKEMVVGPIHDRIDGNRVKGVGKRRADTIEGQLDACLEEEKVFRKKRWMTLIKKLGSNGVMFEPEHIQVGPEDGIGLKIGHSSWDYIELAHNGLYCMDGDFFDSDGIVRRLVRGEYDSSNADF